MQTAIRWALCIIGIEVLFLVAFRAGLLSIVPPLAASCILLAANPEGMFARSGTVLTAYILVGHLGLINSVFWGNDLFCLFVMTLLVVGIMAAVPCIHPPAVALLFQLANSNHPFQAYLVTLCLMGGLLVLHLAGQWFTKQLFRTTPMTTLLLYPTEIGMKTGKADFCSSPTAKSAFPCEAEAY